MRKSVRQLLQLIRRVRRTVAVSRDDLCRRLPEPPAAEGACSEYLDVLEAVLDTAGREVSAAEGAYQAEKSRPIEIRFRRDRTTAALLARYESIQRVLADLPVKGALLLAVTPKNADELAYYMPRVVDFLRELERDPPGPIHGITFDAGALADGLEGGLREMEASITELYAAESAVRLARLEANEAFARADKVVSSVARGFDSLKDLADL